MQIKISREWYEYKKGNCYHSNRKATFEIESLEKIETEIEDIINNLKYNYYKSSNGEMILAPLDSVLLHKSKTNITLNYTFLLCNGKVLNQSFKIIDKEYLEKVKKMRRIDMIMTNENGLDILAEIMCNDCCKFCDLDIHCDDCTDFDYKEVAKKYLSEEIDIPMKDIKLEKSAEVLREVLKNVEQKHDCKEDNKFMDIYKDIVDNMVDICIKKNKDYGSSVVDSYEKFGDISYLTRITDKYNRLVSLYSHQDKHEVADEKYEDTIKDLANYCLLWLANRELVKGDK